MQTVQNHSNKRHDFYRNIHKCLRALIADTLVRLGKLDSNDEQECAAALAQVQSLCSFTEGHLQHEDLHVHPAMEAVTPGSTHAAASEHPHHVQECRQLSALAHEALAARGEQRADLVARLYHQLGLFMADSLHHMYMEETDNNAVLWASYSDMQLIGIEMAIVATLTPEEHGMSMRWMLPSLTPSERLELMSGMRNGAPVQVFCGMMEALRDFLDARQWQLLAEGLGYESQPLAA